MRKTYVKTFDIWPVPDYVRGHIQPGQWVTAGPEGPKGQYLGQRPGCSDVVAWQGRGLGRRGYVKALRDYAKGAAKWPDERSAS